MELLLVPKRIVTVSDRECVCLTFNGALKSRVFRSVLRVVCYVRASSSGRRKYGINTYEQGWKKQMMMRGVRHSDYHCITVR